MEKRLVSFRLPDDLMQGLKARAEADGTSVTELMCRFAWQGLQAGGNPQPGSVDVDTRERLARLEERVSHLTKLETFMFSLAGNTLQGQFQTK